MNSPGDSLSTLFRAMFRQELDAAVRRAMREELPEILNDLQPASDSLLSVSHAAKYLDVDPKTIHRRIRDGKLKAYGKGNLTRIRRRDLLLVLDSDAGEIVDIDEFAKKIVREE